MADYNKAIELNPKDSTAYLDRGKLYAQSNDFDHAKVDFQKVVDLNTDPELVKESQDVLAQLK